MHSLEAIFQEINEKHFDGFLDAPEFAWNSRLRSAAGRFIPGSRKFFRQAPPKIEVASYLIEEEAAATLIYDTIAHEMIHLWLWVRRRPYGHTEEFMVKMRAMGASRYNPVPKHPSPKYIYRCPACNRDFPARKKLGVLACLDCCKRESGGKFDRRFRLEMVEQLR
jgi:predicted SprT family Zn-dependent metalloprotease